MLKKLLGFDSTTGALVLVGVLFKLGTGRHREVSPTMYVLSVLFLLKFIFT